MNTTPLAYQLSGHITAEAPLKIHGGTRRAKRSCFIHRSSTRRVVVIPLKSTYLGTLRRPVLL